MKNKKIIIIGIMIIAILCLAGTVAWYIWTSSNTSLSLNVCAPQISFVGGTTLNGDGLIPTVNKEKGLKKQIDVYLNKVCKEGDSAVMNLYMTLDLLPVELRHETFIFEVVKDDVVLYSGNFKDKQQGQTITLLSNQVITEDDSIYFVYVYIDGTRDNPSSMENKSFKFTVYGEGTDAIYKENVMADSNTPSSSSSTFLNTSIARSSIQTLTIAKDNTVPEGSQDTAKDISSSEDGSVMLWYTYNEETDKYDIYIGGANGKVETNTNGQGMFAYLENVESLDLTNLDTSNITNMSSMFQGSSNLKTIELSNFDTSNVTSMKSMFSDCNNLTTLDVSSFDTSNVTNMGSMFYGCSSLTSLDLSGFDTSKVTNMNSTFRGCTALTTMDVSTWDTSNITNMHRMFMSCDSLTTLDVSNWDTSQVGDMERMFAGCSKLTTLDVSNWDTSSVTDMELIFSDCSSLTTLDVSNWDTSGLSAMTKLFYNCSSLTALDVSDWDTSNVLYAEQTFYGCSSLTTLDVSNWNTANITSMYLLFCGCSSLTTIDLSSFNTSNVIDMHQMFYNCNSLTTLDLSNFNTQNVSNMKEMFRGCSSLTTLDLSGFNTSAVTDMGGMFGYCSNLRTIYISGLWNVENVTSSSNMFVNCTSLVGGSGTTFNSSYANKTYARADEPTKGTPGYLTLKTANS